MRKIQTSPDRVIKWFFTYAMPILALVKTIKNKDRRFFVFVESPLIGLVVTPLSVRFTEILLDIPPVYDIHYIYNMLQVYAAYQVAQVIRDGVNTDADLTQKTKWLLNWFYSVICYVFFTAGNRWMQAVDSQEKAFACALIVFSVLWPILSQFLGTCLWTPVLFSKFPKKTLLENLFDNNVSGDTLLMQIGSCYSYSDHLPKGTPVCPQRGNQDQNCPGINKSDVWNTRWIKWAKKKTVLEKEFGIPKRLQYWIFKTLFSSSVGIVMTGLYFAMRWSSVGTSAWNPAFLTSWCGHYLLPLFGFFNTET